MQALSAPFSQDNTIEANVNKLLEKIPKYWQSPGCLSSLMITALRGIIVRIRWLGSTNVTQRQPSQFRNQGSGVNPILLNAGPISAFAMKSFHTSPVR